MAGVVVLAALSGQLPERVGEHVGGDVEKRRHKRYQRRISVRYGEKELERTGFTYDLSVGGAFVCTGNLPPIGTRLHLQFVLSPERTCFYEGIVCRHRIVPAQLRTIQRNGFGVRFLSSTELFGEIVPQSQVGNRFELIFVDAARLRDCLERELRFGGLFVRTERPLPRDSAVVVELQMPFAGKTLEFPGRVVQVISGAVQGLAVAFEQPDAVQQSLQALLRQ